MIDLQHLIVEIVTAEEPVGGIMTHALTNRVAARYAARQVQPPDSFEIKQAVMDLLAADALVLTGARRLRLPEPKRQPKPPPPKRPEWSGKENPSGVYPIGVGDPLYNGAGDTVAIVRSIKIHTESYGPGEFRMASRVVLLEVEAAFDRLQSTDGATINVQGEIPPKAKPGSQLAPPGIPDSKKYAKHSWDDF